MTTMASRGILTEQDALRQRVEWTVEDLELSIERARVAIRYLRRKSVTTATADILDQAGADLDRALSRANLLIRAGHPEHAVAFEHRATRARHRIVQEVNA